MFGIGDTEFLLILIFAFLLFGPEKLPGLGKTLGKGLRQFREASDSVTKVVKTEVLNPVQDEMKKASTDQDTTSRQPSSPQPTETFAQKKARMEQAYKATEKVSAAKDSSSAEKPAAAEGFYNAGKPPAAGRFSGMRESPVAEDSAGTVKPAVAKESSDTRKSLAGEGTSSAKDSIETQTIQFAPSDVRQQQ